MMSRLGKCRCLFIINSIVALMFSTLASACSIRPKAESDDSEVSSAMATLETGDTFTFGTYEQNNDWLESEPIQWMVLSREGDTISAISKNIIDCMPLDDIEPVEGTNWSQSSLCNWLNGEFLELAFTDADLMRLQAGSRSEYVSLLDSQSDGPKLGDAQLTDYARRAFVEAQARRTSDGAVEGVVSDTLRSDKTEGNSQCIWWLKSSIDDNGMAKAFSYDEGPIDIPATADYVGIRPVITISI